MYSIHVYVFYIYISLLLPTSALTNFEPGGEGGEMPPDKDAAASEVSMYLLYVFYVCICIIYMYCC